MIVTWTTVITGKVEKRSDFGYGSNPVWVGIADELDLRHKSKVKDDAKIFGPSSWKYRVAVNRVREDSEVASLGWAIRNLVWGMLTLKGLLDI